MNEQPTVRRRPAGATEAAGTIIGGRYTIQREIARGGMATVYLAQDGVLNRPVAIKVLTGDVAEGERDSFLREARAVAQLSHPNIVEVYDAGVEGSLRYIVMQYVPGETLRDVLGREGALDPRRAVELTIRLADALDYGHRRGVVHCDMKPGNVLLGDHGEPKIVDFGIARNTATADIPTAIAGTVGYVAPEQVEGRPLDGRADVYSLAAVLYEMLVGVPPYRGANLAAVAAQRLVQPPTPLRELNPAVPPELEAIVLRGLARDPAGRYPAAHDFAEALRAFLNTLLDGRTRRTARPVEAATERIAPAAAGATELLTGPARRGAAPAPTPVLPREAAREPRTPWLFITVAGTLAAVLTALVVLLGVNFLGGDGGMTTVPDVIGARLDDAAQRIQGAGLDVQTVRFEANPAPFGTVFEQDPPAGVTLERDGNVDLRVSDGTNPR